MNANDIIEEAEKTLKNQFLAADLNEEICTRRILDAFRKHEVSYRHFAPTTGYGYDDVGRDTLEAVYADVFGTEACIVRPQIASGTHALSLTLFGLTKPGDTILSVTGLPYDTLHGIIGIGNNATPGSLKEHGVSFNSVSLGTNGKIDIEAARNAMTKSTKLVIAQRSRGYDWRPSLMPEAFDEIAQMIHAEFPDAVFMVDNCYGEFVRPDEPSQHGADVIVGSMIKNPGGGIAPTGGYIAGTQKAIDRISWRLTAPGIGREIGSYEASYRPFFQGFFLSPHVVAQALKTAMLAAAVFEMIGLKATPASTDLRADIIQAIQFEQPERLIAFCQAIQAVSPIDSMAVPEPWEMPGYADPVIMAAGTFVAGASIELSADGPMRSPYTAYMQGGLTYTHGKIAMTEALKKIIE